VSSTPERLAAALRRLPVTIDAVDVAVRAIAVPSYGGLRPRSVATLAGGGHTGSGEHVGWTEAAHRAFAARAPDATPRGTWTVESLATRLDAQALPSYDRAALEAAAIWLALAQAGTTLATLAAVTPRGPRTVVSFARCDDPAAEAARHPGRELKVDVDPDWPEATWRALAAAGRVVTLDWKGSGHASAYARARAAFPSAIHEDPAPPLPAPIAAALALDQPVVTAAVARERRPRHCNLKPARMGGVLEALATAGACAACGIGVYVGGMFELGVGRAQLRELAAILCPDAPNDLAPIALAEAPPNP
jgi:hypothetical protein